VSVNSSILITESLGLRILTHTNAMSLSVFLALRGGRNPSIECSPLSEAGGWLHSHVRCNY